MWFTALNDFLVAPARLVRDSPTLAWLRRAWTRLRPISLEEFIVLLASRAAEGQFRQIVHAGERHPRLRRRARQALHTAHIDSAAIHAAELIAGAWISVGAFDEAIVCDWMMPLLQRSTERYLPRMAVARYLVARLGRVRDPQGIVSAIEVHVRPLSSSDYSNFRTAFSMQTWPILRRCLTEPRLMSELDLFVTAADRALFWKTFNEANPS